MANTHQTADRTDLPSLLRASLGTMKLKDVAEKAGISRSSLSAAVTGAKGIGCSAIVSLARALGLNPAPMLLASARDDIKDESLKALVPMPSLMASLPSDDVADSDADPRADFIVARRHEARIHDYHAAEWHIRQEIAPNGDAFIRRRYYRLRPNPDGRVVRDLVFRERALGVAIREESPGHQLSEVPAGVAYTFRSDPAGPWWIHRLHFPDGWRAGDGPVTFAHEALIPGAYATDADQYKKLLATEAPAFDDAPPRGTFAACVHQHVERLELQLSAAPNIPLDSFTAWAWPGNAPIEHAGRNLIDSGVCAAHRLATKGNDATLVIDRPLSGYSYAVAWIPRFRRK